LRESLQGKPLQRLERCDGKLSRTVLRGLGDGNIPRLPDASDGKMSKRIVLKNKEDAERHIESLRRSAEESQFKIDEISSYSNPLEFLRQIKFEKIGFDPLDAERPLNLIEQVNQTFTYFASFKAAGYLFDRHKGIDSLTLNLGTRSGLDIESSFDGGIAAEVFAAVHPNNNNRSKRT